MLKQFEFVFCPIDFYHLLGGSFPYNCSKTLDFRYTGRKFVTIKHLALIYVTNKQDHFDTFE